MATLVIFENFLREFDPNDVSTLLCVQTVVLLGEGGQADRVIGTKLITTRREEEDFLFACVGIAASSEQPIALLEFDTRLGGPAKVARPLDELVKESMNA